MKPQLHISKTDYIYQIEVEIGLYSLIKATTSRYS